ncbi:MAG: DUF3329 domain-containing protein, partial [Burkholderiales bacterium]|nr:DUF3329 domain-containing protein [Burkholderiales bacterium]
MWEIAVRMLGPLAAGLVGAAVGWLIGQPIGWPRAALAAGAVLGAGAVLLRDALRAWRLMHWLRAAPGAEVPRSGGFWGELAYRIERSLRRHERAVEQERRRLSQFLSAIEASPNGFILLDAHDQIEWCNAAAAQHFGLQPVRDLRQRITNLIRVPAFVAYLQAAHFDTPVTFVGPAGEATLSVLVRPYGEGARLVLSQDVTERERADAMRRDFVANVSHEIRTPLTVLAGFVETLAQLPLAEDERARVLALMAQQADRMQALVADLLTLAQLEGSPPPATDRWFGVAALLARARSDGAALSGGRHALVASGGEDADIAASEPELHSAVANLVGNALRYTPDGGRIELRWVWRDDGGGAIEVIDNGIGIAREHLPRLTERFYR